MLTQMYNDAIAKLVKVYIRIDYIAPNMTYTSLYKSTRAALNILAVKRGINAERLFTEDNFTTYTDKIYSSDRGAVCSFNAYSSVISQ